MKKVYFVRHGQTDNNQLRVSGKGSDPLSKLGEKQAALVGPRLKELGIEVILSSTLKRAHQTAEIINETLHLPLETSALFVESKHAQGVEGKSFDDPETNIIRAQLKEYWADPTWKHSTEENYFDLSARAKEALDVIAKRPERIILLVTHGAFLRMLTWQILMGELLTPELTTKLHKAVAPTNTGVTVAEYSDDGHWLLVRYNDTIHLDPEKGTF
jgi:broad specificity phosphatase PhoE